MDKRQKNLHIKIADKLILDEDFYEALLRDELFTDGMLNLIKAEETRKKRVYKMLELLEKRGQDAFDNFMHYQWLTTELEKQHNSKLQRSQQGKESNEQNYQTQLKHFSNDPYPIYNPKVSNHEAVFTPNPQQRASRHNIPSQEKQYKDACMSPIGIIESPRKNIHAMSYPTHQQRHTIDETRSVDSNDKGFDESPSQTATVTTSTNNHDKSQITRLSTPDEQSEGFVKVLACDDGLEGSDNDFRASEADFVSVRGGSQLSNLSDDGFHQGCSRIKDEDKNATGSEISYVQSKAYQDQKEEMRKFYIKLNTITSENDDTEDLEDEFVTWKMIYTETDKLINRLENSDDTKIIRKCYERFPEKERKQPLYACIKRLFADKKELENRLREKQREMDQMVFDLWKHQQDMSSISKLKKTLAHKEIENNNLKTSLENLEKDADIKLKQMEEKIKDLESRHLEQPEDLQRKPGAATRRGPNNQRRVSNAQGQSPRRQPSFEKPRISQMHVAYAQQSPRYMSTAMRRAPGKRK